MLYNLSNLIANIKSGLKTKKLVIKCNKNNFIKRILNKLIYEGYLRSYSVDVNFNKILVHLKYDEKFSPVIRDIKIISTSGNRVYFTYRQVLQAYIKGENYILTTNRGLFSINELVYNRLFIGGEVVLQVFLY